MSAIDRCVEAARSGEVLSPKDITAARAELAALRAKVKVMRAALEKLVQEGEQEAADDGEDDLTEATPHLDEARAALEPFP